MAKVQIKSEKLTPFGGIFSIMEQFDSTLSSVIDSTLGPRCRLFGYQYREIIRSLMSIYFCGGSCIEDVTTHLMNHLSLHPTLRTCSSDTILRAIKELTQENISYTSDAGKNYDFNTADTLNTLRRRGNSPWITPCAHFLIYIFVTSPQCKSSAMWRITSCSSKSSLKNCGIAS